MQIIGIAGESGVGKSTIANIISFYLGNENTLRLSTDDLHKWDRTSPMWDKYTHLNPFANNLELGDIHISELQKGNSIYRSVYNHATGYFDPPLKLDPKKFIINEGLHAYYSDLLDHLTDIKIFIDTDENLRTHWKLIRDTESRGYKYNTVVDIINRRKEDASIIRKNQIDKADVVIKIESAEPIENIGVVNENVIIEISSILNGDTDKHPMISFIGDFFNCLSDFVKISKIIGNDIELCQNNGGNVSVKVDNTIMIIKSSGIELKDIHGMNGHTVVNLSTIIDGFNHNTIGNESTLDDVINNSISLSEYSKPSMETGFHSFMNKYVIHTHPIYLNAILCLKNSQEIIADLYKEFKYSYIEYCNPGYDLARAVYDADNEDIYFLENHGLIVCSVHYGEAVSLSTELNNIAKKYLMSVANNYEDFSIEFADMALNRNFFYPDSAVFLDDEVIDKLEILAAHNYINYISSNIGELRLLSDENIHYLKNMSAEIYRKSI